MYFTTFDPFARDFQRQFARRAFGPSAVMPLDAVRRDGEAMLRFDVPGIDPDSIEVTVDRGLLSVSVNRQEERPGNTRVHVPEPPIGTFTRPRHLPAHLNATPPQTHSPTP